MVSNINQIVYQLFQKETLEQVSENELRYFIRQYPYSGTGHLLLAKKLQLDGEKRAFDREIAVTSVYFTNPAWLQFVLKPPAEELSFSATATGETAEVAVLPEAATESEPLSLMDYQHETTEMEERSEAATDDLPGESDFVMSDISEVITDPETQNENGNAEFTTEEFETHVTPEVTDYNKPAQTEAASGEEVAAETPLAAGEQITAGTTEPVEDNEVQELPAIEQPAEEVLFENVKPVTPIDAPGVEKLEFDPYHTIDYFASQGIKLRLEDYSRDKLGQQLKSFTEWIRSMKRLPQQAAPGLDETDQHSIRRIAEHSVEEKEVLTESMAEVWAKQGNYEKARQVYRKLSLQNPAKSVYFAAKIEQLKVL